MKEACTWARPKTTTRTPRYITGRAARLTTSTGSAWVQASTPGPPDSRIPRLATGRGQVQHRHPCVAAQGRHPREEGLVELVEATVEGRLEPPPSQGHGGQREEVEVVDVDAAEPAAGQGEVVVPQRVLVGRAHLRCPLAVGVD